MVEDKVEGPNVATAEEYKKSQKGYISVQSGFTFEVEMINFEKHLEIFNTLSDKFPKIRKATMVLAITTDRKMQQEYAMLALPLFVKAPKVTARQTKNSVGVNKIHYLDLTELVAQCLLGIKSSEKLIASFLEGESDTKEAIDKLLYVQDETGESD